MAKTTVKITIGEAQSEFLVALKGLFAWNCGSITFKGKVASLEREIKRAISKDMEELTTKEQLFFRKYERAQDEARAANVNFVATDELYEEQMKLRREQNRVLSKEIEISIPLIFTTDLPSEEDIEKQQPYSYSKSTANGQPVYAQYTPNTLVGWLLGVLIVEPETA